MMKILYVLLLMLSSLSANASEMNLMPDDNRMTKIPGFFFHGFEQAFSNDISCSHIPQEIQICNEEGLCYLYTDDDIFLAKYDSCYGKDSEKAKNKRAAVARFRAWERKYHPDHAAKSDGHITIEASEADLLDDSFMSNLNQYQYQIAIDEESYASKAKNTRKVTIVETDRGVVLSINDRGQVKSLKYEKGDIVKIHATIIGMTIGLATSIYVATSSSPAAGKLMVMAATLGLVGAVSEYSKYTNEMAEVRRLQEQMVKEALEKARAEEEEKKSKKTTYTRVGGDGPSRYLGEDITGVECSGTIRACTSIDGGPEVCTLIQDCSGSF